MTFKPGQSENPKGRTPGRRNAKTRAVLEKLNGVADALALLGEMVVSAEAPLALRVTAATALAPYQYPKAPRLLRKEIDLPEPVTHRGRDCEHCPHWGIRSGAPDRAR